MVAVSGSKRSEENKIVVSLLGKKCIAEIFSTLFAGVIETDMYDDVPTTLSLSHEGAHRSAPSALHCDCSVSSSADPI